MPTRGTLVATTFALAMLAACQGGDKQAEALEERTQAPKEQEFVDFRMINLPDTVAANRAVRKDSGGEFIAIDDMHFRVARRPDGKFAIRGGHAGRLWPNAALGYRLAPEVRANPTYVRQFENACRIMTQGTAVRCIDVDAGPSVTDKYFVYVVDSQENSSYVGWQEEAGGQDLSIYNWDNVFIIAHELKHALGWEHEHQRPDRDAYIEVRTANIQSDYTFAFEILGTTATKPYDFDSIMHYGQFAFSANNQATIVPLPQHAEAAKTMGQRDHLSVHELKEIIAYYGDAKTEWCGQYRMPKALPRGCFYKCIAGGDWAYAKPQWCGTCQKPGQPCK